MEILSDATFKGSVRIENPSFSIGNVLTIQNDAMSEFGISIGSNSLTANTIGIRCGIIYAYGSASYQQTFQPNSGTIALKSDIPNISSINSVKYMDTFLTAPSDCTLFAVDLDVNDFSFTGPDRIISARVDKYHWDNSPAVDGGTGLGCWWEPTSMDVILSNTHEPGKVLIRKASGVVCDNTTNYKLKVFYI